MTRAAVCNDGALHCLYQSFAQCQAETGAAKPAAGAVVCLGKGLEDSVQMLLGDADTGILDIEAHTA